MSKDFTIQNTVPVPPNQKKPLRIIVNYKSRHNASNSLHILVPPSTKTNNNIPPRTQLLRNTHSPSNSMRTLKCRHNSLKLTEQRKGHQNLRIICRDKSSPTRLLPTRQLRSNSRIIKSSRDKMRLANLPILIPRQISPQAVQHTDRPSAQQSRVLIRHRPITTRLDANKSNR